MRSILVTETTLVHVLLILMLFSNAALALVLRDTILGFVRKVLARLHAISFHRSTQWFVWVWVDFICWVHRGIVQEVLGWLILRTLNQILKLQDIRTSSLCCTVSVLHPPWNYIELRSLLFTRSVWVTIVFKCRNSWHLETCSSEFLLSFDSTFCFMVRCL